MRIIIMMKQITDYRQIAELEQKYKTKGTVTNNYLLREQYESLISENALGVIANECNCFFFVKKDVGTRIYYYLNDLNEDADFTQYNDLVIEILFRGELPVEQMEYFSKRGFRVNLVRDQYAGMYKDLASNITLVQGVLVEMAENLEQVRMACELFNASFDALSGDFIPESTYEELLKKESVLIAWDMSKQTFLGALHQVKEGPVNVIGHVAVVEAARGHGVGKALVDTFVEWNKNSEKTEKTRYQLWVQRQNEAAVRMYQNKGFKYINKSTISLIK